MPLNLMKASRIVPGDLTRNPGTREPGTQNLEPGPGTWNPLKLYLAAS